MTDKQRRFVDEYMIDYNASAACLRAGFKTKNPDSTGAKIKAKPEVAEEIQRRLDAIQSEKTADAKEVIEYLTSVLRGESESHVLSMCGDGFQEVITKHPDEKERLRAAELLGKRYSLFNDKVNVEGVLPVVISGGEALED